MLYYLNKDTVPTIPTPHDCVIKKATIQEDYIIFEFEDDISYHDSIQYFNPDAKSLVIKIHLIEDFDTYKMKHYRRPWCKGDYARIDNAQLEKIAKQERLEYLYHYVSYQSIIIKLWSQTYITLDVQADYVEYDWIV